MKYTVLYLCFCLFSIYLFIYLGHNSSCIWLECVQALQLFIFWWLWFSVGEMTTYSIMLSPCRCTILTPCLRAGAWSASCPLLSSTLRPAPVAVSSTLWAQRWRSQTPSTPLWTASSATTPRWTSGAVWWQSLASSSTPRWSRQCLLMIHYISVTCQHIR